MSENLFNSLQSVRGFADANGKTYQEHICLIFDLSPEQKTTIMSKDTAAAALKYLSTIADYTHTHNLR